MSIFKKCELQSYPFYICQKLTENYAQLGTQYKVLLNSLKCHIICSHMLLQSDINVASRILTAYTAVISSQTLVGLSN